MEMNCILTRLQLLEYSISKREVGRLYRKMNKILLNTLDSHVAVTDRKAEALEAQGLTYHY